MIVDSLAVSGKMFSDGQTVIPVSVKHFNFFLSSSLEIQEIMFLEKQQQKNNRK